MSMSLRKKIPFTCRYWKEGKCFKGEFQCSYVHGYVCPDDGRCSREHCSHMHIHQKKQHSQRDYHSKHQNHQRQGYRSRYRRSRSRSISPVRHQRAVYRGRTPPRYRSRSRSPSHHHSRGYNSHRRSRSPSPSRGLSRTWNPIWRESKSRSPSRHRGLAELRSRSNSPAQRRSRSRSIVHERQRDVGDIYSDLDKEFDGETEAVISPKSDQSNPKAVDNITLSEIQAHITRNLLSPPTQMLKDILETAKDKKSMDSPQWQEDYEGPFSPTDHTELDDLDLNLEEVGEEVDDIFSKSITHSVEDSIGSAFEEGLKRGKRKRELQVGSNPSPPKDESQQKSANDCDTSYHTDWKNVPQEKQTEAPAPSKDFGSVSKSNNSSLWGQALDHSHGQESKLKMTYQTGASDWEVETPYVGRKEKVKVQRGEADTGKETESGSLPARTYENVPITSERIPEQKVEKPTQSNTMLFPSGHSIPVGVLSSGGSYGSTSHVQSSASEEGARSSRKLSEECNKTRRQSDSPKRSKHKRHKEKRSKRKKNFSESESDSSDHEGRKMKKNSSPEVEKEKDEVSVLLAKKDSLMKRVNLLVEQKNRMNEQRVDIMKNHKGSRETLSSILEENLLLTKEIGKQIVKLNDIVHKVTKEIELKGDFKQKHKSIPRERSKSPHYSREKQKPEYSPERDKHRRAPYSHIADRSELDISSSMQVKRPRSPGKKESWSPVPCRLSTQQESSGQSGSLEKDYTHSRSPRLSEQMRSRSPLHKLPKQIRSGSPNPGFSSETTKNSYAESKRSQSPQKKHPVCNITETREKETGPPGRGKQEVTDAETYEQLQHAPHAAQRTYIRYTDQGMHWCRLCSMFTETMPEYVDHLMTSSHMARVKNDRKSWLAKAPKEEKEPRPPNAQVMTVPLQGIEFLHSLPSYYCSLCDIFMRDKGEILKHPESKIHVSKFKVHRAKNPLYETTFLKAKTAAFKKCVIDKAKKDQETLFNLKEKNEAEEKLLRQIKEKQKKDKYDKESKDDKVIKESKDEKKRACGSIRVASRGAMHSGDKKSDRHVESIKRSEGNQAPLQEGLKNSRGTMHSGDKKSDNQRHVESVKKPESNKASVQEGLTQKCKLHEEISRKDEPQKNEEAQIDIDKGKVDIDIVESESVGITADEPSKDKEEEKKFGFPKLPLIGKMPFLKKKPTLSKTKEHPKMLPPKQELLGQKHDLSKAEAKASTLIDIPLPNQEIKVEMKSENIADCVMSINQQSLTVEEEIKDEISLVQEEPPQGQDSEEISKNIAASVCAENKDIFPSDPVISFEEHSSELNTWDNDEKSDSDDSKMYDNLEIENEVSSECAAAATLHALDLLSIQLPGLKPAIDIPPSLDILLPPEKEHETHSQDISKTYEPLCEPVDEVAEGSGILRNSEIPLPPGIGDISQKQNETSQPPPPGTEECPDYILGSDNDAVVVPANIVPVFKPSSQELSSGAWSTGSNSQDYGVSAFSIGSNQNSDIPLPPGTEDEHCVQELSIISPPSGVVEDASGLGLKGRSIQFFTKQLSSEACSSDSNSVDEVLIPQSGADVTSSSLPVGLGHQHWPAVQTSSRPVALPLPTNLKEWNPLHHTERESTPPPPGTENLIVKELEDKPAELGEASMELSEGNESEDEHTRREVTPPPPGTEDADKETTPLPPGTEASSRCLPASAFSKTIPVSKSSPLISRIKSTLDAKSCVDNMGSEMVSSPNANTELSSYFDNEKQHFAELCSEMQLENEENSIPLKKVRVEINSGNSSSSQDLIPCFSPKEQSLCTESKGEKVKRSDVDLQISTDQWVDRSKDSIVHSVRDHESSNLKVDLKDHEASNIEMDSKDHETSNLEVKDTKDKETSNIEVDSKDHETSALEMKDSKEHSAKNLEIHNLEVEDSEDHSAKDLEISNLEVKDSEDHSAKNHDASNLEIFTCENKISLTLRCGDVEHTEHLSKYSEVESMKADTNDKVQDSVYKALGNESESAKEETHSSVVCDKYPHEDNKHVEQWSNVDLSPSSGETDIQLSTYDIDFKDNLVGDCPGSATRFSKDVHNHIIKDETNDFEVLTLEIDESSQPRCGDADYAKHSSYSKTVFEVSEECPNVIESIRDGSVESENSGKEETSTLTSEIESPVLHMEPHIDSEHLEKCINVSWLSTSGIQTTAEASCAGQVDSGRDLDDDELQEYQQDLGENLNTKGYHEQGDDTEGKRSSHELTKSTHSVVIHGEENLRSERARLRRTPRSTKGKKAEDTCIIYVTTKTKGTTNNPEEEPENIETRLQQQTSESSETLFTLEMEEPKEERPSFRKSKATKSLAIQQGSNTKQRRGLRSTRGMTLALTQDEKLRTELSASPVTSTSEEEKSEKHRTELSASPVTCTSSEEEKSDASLSQKKLDVDIEEWAYDELEIQSEEIETPSLRRTCRTTRSRTIEKPPQRKPAKMIRAIVTQEKLKTEQITSHTTTRVTNTVFEIGQEKAAVNASLKELEKYLKEVVNKDTESEEEDCLNVPQSSNITEKSKAVKSDNEGDEESTKKHKKSRSKRAPRSEKAEEKSETEVPTRKKTRSTSCKNQMSQKVPEVDCSVRVRRSRRAAIAASAAMTAQVQEIFPSANSPSEETS